MRKKNLSMLRNVKPLELARSCATLRLCKAPTALFFLCKKTFWIYSWPPTLENIKIYLFPIRVNESGNLMAQPVV